MTIREMTAADVEAVAALEAEIFSMPWSVQGFEITLCRDDVVFLVAYETNTLLGYAGVYCTADEGEITNVAVAEPARRGGVAYALMNRLIEVLAGRGIFRIVLEVRVSNEPAIRLYEKLGFINAGIRKSFYEKPTEDAYVMVFQPTVYYGTGKDVSI